MFSFAGDTVLDPFAGTGTTSLAALDAGRSSISVEIDPAYFDESIQRISDHLAKMDFRAGPRDGTLLLGWSER